MSVKFDFEDLLATAIENENKLRLTDYSYKCHNCYANTYMRVLDHRAREIYSASTEDDGRPISAVEEILLTLLCPNCEKRNIALIEQPSDWDETLKGEIIYPYAPMIIGSEQIRAALNTANKIAAFDPRIALALYRIVIEMVWQEKCQTTDKKPKLRGDNGMIADLYKKNILPGKYVEMADILAYVGNNGAHASQQEITLEHLQKARQICNAILSHVYVNQDAGLEALASLETDFPRESGWHEGKFYYKDEWKAKKTKSDLETS